VVNIGQLAKARSSHAGQMRKVANQAIVKFDRASRDNAPGLTRSDQLRASSRGKTEGPSVTHHDWV